MRLLRPQRHQRLALLFAALLLLCNALVTAHAFGDVDHAVKDGCQICHQFERQTHAPATALPQAQDTRRHEAAAGVVVPGIERAFAASFRSRAPPHA